MYETNVWINGQKRPSSDGATFSVTNSLTGQVVGHSASSTSQDCKDAAAAAQQAFPAWESLPPSAKQAIFIKALQLLEQDDWKKRFAQTLKDETAATDDLVFVNLFGTKSAFEDAMSLTATLKGESFPSSAPGGHVIVQRRAHGAILSIAPWNAPIVLTVRAIAIPLICGNTIVLKPSELSPKTQELVVELMHAAGIPPGVLNYVPMARETSPKLTSELIGHPVIRHINFTGSDRVGKLIAGEAAKYLKPCVFELGGKAPAVVLEDADLDRAARCIAQGALLHSGQICMSTERVIVQKSVSSKLTEHLQKHFRAIRAGNGGEKAKLSSLVTEGAAAGIVDLLKEAKENGGKVLVGEVERDGAVVQPHLVAGVKPGMRIWERETFGPIVGIAEAETIDEAVELANKTDYSLSASVWTRDVNRAIDVASRIRSGMTSINGSTFHSERMLGHAGLGGATGYGRFDVDNFTIKRMIIIQPNTTKFSLTD